jgi:lipopolysaccharide transport system ATP-binding protein
MNQIAIHVEDLGKRYRIGKSPELAKGNKALLHRLYEPFRYLINSLREPDPDEIIWAIRQITFEVEQGEVLGIIGRNGAGKSTLLKILSRITEPTEGRAILNGRVGSLLEVGTGFHPELTGRENIYLNGTILGMKKVEIDRKFDEIVEFSGIEKFIDTPVKRFSSGMFVRLAFAVAAHLEAEILLVDEVLAVGDAEFQKRSIGKMEDVARQGRTVLFVSHVMPMIQNLCQRVILIQEGQILKDGEPDEVIRSYLEGKASDASTSLAERKDRHGRGEVFLSDIEFLDIDRKPVVHPLSGQDLVVRMHYCTTVDKTIKNCRFSLALFKDEYPYFILSTDMVDKRTIDVKGDGYLDFIIPELPLSEGVYTLTTHIDSNREVQDSIIGVAKLPVIDGDFYGTGKNYPSLAWKGRSVLVKFGWELGEKIYR